MAITFDALREMVAVNPAMKRRGIQRESEFERIDALERRVWSADDAQDLAAVLTEVLRLPHGEQSLRPIQAIALGEIVWRGGCISPIRVGGGKTLVSFLAATVLGSKRPLLLLPAKLIGKTEHELAKYRRHWQIRRKIAIVSYEKLGRISAARLLDELQPDLIIADEAHRLKNKRTGVVRRVKRYVETRRPRFICLSGTLIRSSLNDWATMSDWALGEFSPAPRKWAIVESWRQVLDPGGKVAQIGPMVGWIDPYRGEGVREAYRRRVTESIGVVATTDGFDGASLNLSTIATTQSPELKSAIDKLESSDTWELPDGSILVDAKQAALAARQLELGCYYRWKVAAPKEWLDARKAWSRLVRHILRHSRSLDTDLAIRQAIARGEVNRLWMDPETEEMRRPVDVLAAWDELKAAFAPTTECVWIDDTPVREIAARAKETKALVWVHHKEIGARFAALGLPYYGAGGLDARTGVSIEQAPHEACALSIASNKEGRNLQDRWSSAIVAELPRDAGDVEQLIGRIHRDGQVEDEVDVALHVSTASAEAVLERVKERAQWIYESTGQQQKILEGTWLETRNRPRHTADRQRRGSPPGALPGGARRPTARDLG